MFGWATFDSEILMFGTSLHFFHGHQTYRYHEPDFQNPFAVCPLYGIITSQKQHERNKQSTQLGYLDAPFSKTRPGPAPQARCLSSLASSDQPVAPY